MREGERKEEREKEGGEGKEGGIVPLTRYNVSQSDH